MWPALRNGTTRDISVLTYIDSSMYAESNGASFMKKYWSQVELWPFLYTQVDIFIYFFCKNELNFVLSCMHVSEPLFSPITIVVYIL